jgi:hypothetical protein
MVSRIWGSHGGGYDHADDQKAAASETSTRLENGAASNPTDEVRKTGRAGGLDAGRSTRRVSLVIV